MPAAANIYRDLLCAEVSDKNIGKQTHLSGWVHRRRDHGGVIFIDLRDHTGLVQLVFSPEDKELFSIGEQLRSEFVISVTGEVAKRPPEGINPDLKTGGLEVMISKCEILNKATELPFTPKEYEHANEDLRLEHRSIDMRRALMQSNLRLRSRVNFLLRDFLHTRDFTEIETPILTKETPEGARDYLVPSRTHQGNFFALPQSPQLFKQLLMIGGFNRYYQIARCFRDEDLRADRQPEFTQIDLEMAFTSEEEIMGLAEEMLKKLFKETLNTELPQFPVMSYEEAMNSYGSDRPDLRSPLKLQDITDCVKGCDFKVFSDPAKAKGSKVAVMRVPGGGKISRKDIDDWTEYARALGAKGLAYIKVENIAKGIEAGLVSPIVKFLGEKVTQEILKLSAAEDGDLLFFGADKKEIVHRVLGALRLEVSAKLNLIEDAWRPLWVTEFPMFEEASDTKGDASPALTPLHHPFTAPLLSTPAELDTADPLTLKSRAYDVVINGIELGGGSMRIHHSEVQRKVFELLGIKDAEQNFGFLLKALDSGAPPHGGIAFGLDRLMMLIGKGESIRDYIAFPKTQSATCLLTSAPGSIAPKILRELGIKTKAEDSQDKNKPQSKDSQDKDSQDKNKPQDKDSQDSQDKNKPQSKDSKDSQDKDSQDKNKPQDKDSKDSRGEAAHGGT